MDYSSDYTNEYQAEFEGIRRGYHSDKDIALCRCNGSGWIIASSDIWVECPFHRTSVWVEDIKEVRFYVEWELPSGSGTVLIWYENPEEAIEIARSHRAMGRKTRLFRRIYSL